MPPVSLVPIEQLAEFVNYPIPDSQAQLMCELASGVVRSAAAQVFDYVVDDILLTSPTGIYVFLPEIPVSEVSLVEVLDTSVEVWSTFDAANYRLNGPTGTITVDAGLEFWPTLQNTVRITYTHGYQDIPDPVQKVTLALAARTVANPGRVYVQSTGNISQTFQRETAGVSDLLDTEQQILGRYRNPVLA